MFALPLCYAKNSWHFTSNFWKVCRLTLSIVYALFRNKIGITYLNSFLNLSRNVKNKWKLAYDVTLNLFHIRKGRSSIGTVLWNYYSLVQWKKTPHFGWFLLVSCLVNTIYKVMISNQVSCALLTYRAMCLFAHSRYTRNVVEGMKIFFNGRPYSDCNVFFINVFRFQRKTL